MFQFQADVGSFPCINGYPFYARISYGNEIQTWLETLVFTMVLAVFGRYSISFPYKLVRKRGGADTHGNGPVT